MEQKYLKKWVEHFSGFTEQMTLLVDLYNYMSTYCCKICHESCNIIKSIKNVVVLIVPYNFKNSDMQVLFILSINGTPNKFAMTAIFIDNNSFSENIEQTSNDLLSLYLSKSSTFSTTVRKVTYTTTILSKLLHLSNT